MGPAGTPPADKRGPGWPLEVPPQSDLLFRLRTGILWRDLPPRCEKWKTVYDRHSRWSADGTWDEILRLVQADADASDGST